MFADGARSCRALPVFHWELEFADVLADHGGFDLVLGNPPWLKVEWNEAGLLSEYDALVAVRKLSAKETNDIREDIFSRNSDARDAYLAEYEGQDGTARFLGAKSNYPLLAGAPNLFKCFLPQAWKYGTNVSAFLHPEGVYDDPKGGALRSAMYHRLRYHFQFQNGMMLFPIADRAKYSINVYSQPHAEPSFIHLSNLFTPATIDLCFTHDGEGLVPGIKDSENRWAVAGHRERLIQVEKRVLELFAKTFDDAGTPFDQARLPALHSGKSLQYSTASRAGRKKLATLKARCFRSRCGTKPVRSATVRSRGTHDIRKTLENGYYPGRTSMSVYRSTKHLGESVQKKDTTTASTSTPSRTITCPAPITAPPARAPNTARAPPTSPGPREKRSPSIIGWRSEGGSVLPASGLLSPRLCQKE